VGPLNLLATGPHTQHERSAMLFRILGPMEVSAGEAVAALGPPKQRALLAVLLLHLGEIVPIDQLIDLLWGERPPRTAAHSVQIYVSELRKALEPVGGESLIVTRQPGYQLLANPEEVDASRFEQLVHAGSQLITTGDRDAGVHQLRAAIRLWRGPALSDFAYDDFAQPYIRRLNDLHLDAIEELASAELEAGKTTEVLAPLEAAIREDPLRERSRELLMLALYRSGRHAEALRTYQRLRELLAEELGLEPSPTVVRLQEKILLHDTSLLPPATVATAETTAGRNPYKGLQSFREQDAPDFFGRDALVDELLSSLGRGTRLISLVGPSGSGKSSAVAAGFIPRLREGGIHGSEPWSIATMVPGTNPTADMDAALARAAARSKQRVLLVIDQFEELFSLTDEAERRGFVHQLVETVSKPDSHIAVVLALRADFYDRPLLNAELAAVFVPGVINVVPMTARELEAAIIKPAERVGVSVETGLLAELVAETADRPGALPMLQYALAELFDQHSSKNLSLGDYRKLGGLRGILSRRAEALYRELGPNEQRATMQIFLRLVRLGAGTVDSRRPVRLADLTDLDLDPVTLSKVLETFGRHRFLSFDRDAATGRAVVEVAHEALFREWERLAGWIDRHRIALRRHSTFQAALEEWEASGRNDDYLLAGSRLAEFEAWSREGVLDLTGREREFLDASVRRDAEAREAEALQTKRQRALEGRARRNLVALSGTVALLAAALIFAFVLAQAPAHDRIALLHWRASDVDYLLQRGFDQAVAQHQFVGTDDLASGDGQTDLRQLSGGGNQLILTFSLQPDLFNEVVRKYPETRYVYFDDVGAEANVSYVLLDDNESSFLAGAAAALKTTTGRIGFVGGVDMDKIWRFQAGFEAGAKHVDPNIMILSTYLSPAGDFSGFQSPELGRAAAESMFERGVDIIFAPAGLSAFGAFDAVVAQSEVVGRQLWVIGVDADQYENVRLLPGVTSAEAWRAHILTSVVKRWDQAIVAILDQYAQRTLQAGITSLDLESGGVGIAYSGGYIDDIKPQLEALKAQIIAGQVAVPCLPLGKEGSESGSDASCRR
jgi:basic membrane lipoprotein Med (substrate-binding protein (PBP1-ABC) superfamily)/DNA-binding SARP family transcriptional activator